MKTTTDFTHKNKAKYFFLLGKISQVKKNLCFMALCKKDISVVVSSSKKIYLVSSQAKKSLFSQVKGFSDGRKHTKRLNFIWENKNTFFFCLGKEKNVFRCLHVLIVPP